MITSIWVVISIATTQQWTLHQLDVKNVFLHRDRKEEVRMLPPLGFIREEEQGKVCRLKKAINGLEQSPRAWFDNITTSLNYGFARCR